MGFNDTNKRTSSPDGQVTLSANGATLKTTPFPESKNLGALLEKLSQTLLEADFPVTEQIAKKVEGGAVAFANQK